MPWGASTVLIKSSSCFFVKPRALIVTASEDEFKIRITTRSPKLVGKIDIRKSTSVPSLARYDIFPSWGKRLSAMSRFARILILAITAL